MTGLASRAFIVRSPDDRARAMGERSFDPADPRRRWRSLRLGEICETHPETLRDRLRDYRLVVVHSQEIDDAGEANVGLASFETWISQVPQRLHAPEGRRLHLLRPDRRPRLPAAGLAHARAALRDGARPEATLRPEQRASRGDRTRPRHP